MNVLRVLLKANETGALVDELQGRENVPIDEPIIVASISNGTESGKATVGFVFNLPDGRYAFAETTLALLLTAVRALRAAHDVDENGEPLNPAGSGTPSN